MMFDLCCVNIVRCCWLSKPKFILKTVFAFIIFLYGKFVLMGCKILIQKFDNSFKLGDIFLFASAFRKRFAIVWNSCFHVGHMCSIHRCFSWLMIVRLSSPLADVNLVLGSDLRPTLSNDWCLQLHQNRNDNPRGNHESSEMRNWPPLPIWNSRRNSLNYRPKNSCQIDSSIDLLKEIDYPISKPTLRLSVKYETRR